MNGERPTAPELSIIIPAYNEAARLLHRIPAIQTHLAGKSFEIIVVNDGSQDGTAAAVQAFPGVRLLELQPNRGKGGAVKAGMLAARGRYVLFTDADQSTPIAEMDKLLAKLAAGYDLAIGSRAVPGAVVEQPQVWYRMLAGKLFGLGTRLFCLRGIYDTQCGFKGMTWEVAQTVFPQVTSDSAIFDIELLVVATRAGYRVAEVPVHWVHDPDTRIPYNFWRAVSIWGELFRICRLQRGACPLRVKT